MAATFLGLRTTIYKVGDITQAKHWYAEVLGMEPYFNQPFYVGFNVGGYELGLDPSDSADSKTESVVTYWGVENINDGFQRLLQAGATVHEEPRDVGDGIQVATVKDPWNNVLGIIENPHFSLPSE